MKHYFVVETLCYGEIHYWAGSNNSSDEWVRKQEDAIQFATADSADRVMSLYGLAKGHAKVTEVDNRDKAK